MKLLIIFLSLFSQLTFAKVESDFSGNIEAQGRHSWNGKMAKDDLFQDWNEKDFFLMYGNLNGKFQFKDSKIESNVFARYSHSDLYEKRPVPLPQYAAPLIFTFPNKLVTRDLFKLQHDKQGNQHREELILNKLYYEQHIAGNRFAVGRLYINYGQGEIFNPINPFNQPTGLTSISQIAQGNDGASLTHFSSDQHTIDLFVLGDKSLDSYQGKIDKTLWIHGEYQISDKFQLDYVLGEDQRRYKAGGQIRYNFEDSMLFTQTLYQSEYTDQSDSSNLWDVLVGYDQQLTNKWHVRMEGGYQKQNLALTDRFLPTEYFIAVANQYEIHSLVKLSGTIVNDIKTGFTYFITRNTFDLGHDTEADIFGYIPAGKGSKVSNPAQKLVTTDIGVSLRTFF